MHKLYKIYKVQPYQLQKNQGTTNQVIFNSFIALKEHLKVLKEPIIVQKGMVGR